MLRRAGEHFAGQTGGQRPSGVFLALGADFPSGVLPEAEFPVKGAKGLLQPFPVGKIEAYPAWHSRRMSAASLWANPTSRMGRAAARYSKSCRRCTAHRRGCGSSASAVPGRRAGCVPLGVRGVGNVLHAIVQAVFPQRLEDRGADVARQTDAQVVPEGGVLGAQAGEDFPQLVRLRSALSEPTWHRVNFSSKGGGESGRSSVSYPLVITCNRPRTRGR